ncbi:MAG: hypothetical protein Q7K13_00680 [Polynucleobacter sp.]|uniref:hypothetical protein n=1 Tax=Polynucleobacter sp. TaxID=2029855 RepID=UPI002718CC8F|nr:hypothetical protein [Polynucleobacter sp.]MDO8712987.1 hypothetical protein [Polynucleobacter sp.]
MITFEETVQVVLNVVMEKEKLMVALKEANDKVKDLELKLKVLEDRNKAAVASVREPDNKPVLKEVK